MEEKQSYLQSKNGQRDINIFLGRIVCISESTEKDLHDVLNSNMIDSKDLQKIVEYCFNNKKIILVLHHLPMAFWPELSEEQLRLMYGELELKRQGLNQVWKWLDNLEAPRHTQLQILLNGDR